MPNYEHNTQSKKYTTEPAKVHLNSVMETLRNHSIMKNIGQIQNFRRNTRDLKNSSKTSSTILHFKKMPTNKKNRYLLFMFEWKTVYQGNDLLNLRNELISNCRHKNKFKIMNHKT